MPSSPDSGAHWIARSVLALASTAGLVWVATSPTLLSSAQDGARPAGWSEPTHGDGAAPGYDRLFATDRVHEIRITIAPDDFAAMQADLAALRPGFGRGGRGAPLPFPPIGDGRGGFDPARLAETLGALTGACRDRPAGAACTVEGTTGTCTTVLGDQPMCVPGGLARQAERGGAAPRLVARDPIYVPVTVSHEGRTWPGVGMRYKGNSSLMTAITRSNGKVPFRLDFDRYEDEVPGTADQRFYGFGKLTFSSNFSDDSMLKEVLATEVFRDRGVPAARAAFYRVFVDTGDGPAYWGLYSMVEDPADGAMLDAQFGGRDGNLYKPEGPGAGWTSFDEESFVKKTNEREADFSDVRAAVHALHASRDDPAAWRAGLEASVDVDLFLRWLAVNTAIENWDTYGAIAHNYYLYGDPGAGGRLRWIPWDHNMAFGMAGGGFPGMPGRGGVPGRGGLFGRGGSVLHEEAGGNWPLIARLLADDVYQARYRELLAHTLDGLLAPAAFEARARELHALVAPFAVGEQGERPTHTTLSAPGAFDRALDGPNGLLERVEQRRAQVRDVLGIPAEP